MAVFGPPTRCDVRSIGSLAASQRRSVGSAAHNGPMTQHDLNDTTRAITASGEYRKGAHVVSVSMDPAFVPPSGSMNPAATVAQAPAASPQSVQAPTASAIPAQTK